MRITRYASLSEPQFLGCVSAFTDALTGELNSAAMYLRKLEGQTKGAAFAYEMSLDRHRYGALTVLDRWGALVGGVRAAPDAQPLSGHPRRSGRAGAHRRVHPGKRQSIDRRGRSLFGSDVVEACLLAFQSLAGVFAEERQAAAQSAQLGPLLPEEFKEARGIFLQDLSAR